MDKSIRARHGRLFQIAFFALLTICGGCATFEFDVVKPESQAQRVTNDAATTISISPMEYLLQADSGRLVMRIFNRADESIQLLGSRSVVVDPTGQSHPLHDETIAPGTFVREILPPFPPERSQPNFSVGLGVGVSRAEDPDYVAPRGFTEPSRIDVAADSPAYYWEWDGDTEVRVNLVYGRGERTFEQRLVFRRVRK